MKLAGEWKLYAALSIAMIALRQDFWLWHDGRLVLGYLPVGLAWQAGYSLLAAVVMALLVRYRWPRDLERFEPPRGTGERRR